MYATDNNSNGESDKIYNTFGRDKHDIQTTSPELCKEPINKRKVAIYYAISTATVVLLVMVLYTSSTANSQSSSTTIAASSKSTSLDFSTTEETTTSQPNFVFILADDLSWNSMGYMHYDLESFSPTLTAMAESGVIMSNFYAQEICTPSRVALMTGRYPSTVGMQYHEVTTVMEFGLSLDETLFPEVMRDAGYTNYMIGKWNLGHYTPQYLPTARGFDQYLGYLGAEMFPWSKVSKLSGYTVYDSIYSDTECYQRYGEDDAETYSTILYKNKAQHIIKNHNFDDGPMFLYFAAQAVHDPFNDVEYPDYSSGIPISYVGIPRYEAIEESVVGDKRKQYALSLSVLDNAVLTMKNALEKRNQLNNTYFIFASDNGGCADAGGANAPLRGTKGSLFEGGVKVNSFIYAHGQNLMGSDLYNTEYTGLMHMSDWFPTILELAGIEYTAASGYELDGVSQREAWTTNKSPRDYLLINMYSNVEDDLGVTYNTTNSNCAVRDNQFKLMHHYDGGISVKYYDFTETMSNDDEIGVVDPCQISAAMNGTFEYFLFDMKNDPYETTNLYYQDAYRHIRDTLEDKLLEYEAMAKHVGTISSSSEASTYFSSHDAFIQPFITDQVSSNNKAYPSACANGTKPRTLFA